MTGNHSFDGLACDTGFKAAGRVESIFYGYLLPIICFFGFCFNFVLVTLYGDIKPKLPVFIFLHWLTFLQIISIFVHAFAFLAWSHLGGIIWSELYTAYIYWPAYCYANSTSMAMALGVVLERYLEMKRSNNLKEDEKKRYKKTNRICNFICLFNILFNIPRFLELTIDWETYCSVKRQWEFLWVEMLVHSIAHSAIHIVLLVAIFIYGILVWEIFYQNSPKYLQSLSMSGTYVAPHFVSESRKNTKLVISIGIIFTLTEFPKTIFSTVSEFVELEKGTSRNFYHSLMLFVYSCSVFQFLAIPIVIFSQNKHIRKIFKKRWLILINELQDENKSGGKRRKSLVPSWLLAYGGDINGITTDKEEEEGGDSNMERMTIV